MLEPIGLLTEADLEEFTALCRAWSRLEEAEQFYRAELRRWRKRKSPSVAELRPAQLSVERAEFSFRTLAAEFGLSPASRSRMDVPPPRSGEEDFEEYLAQQQARARARNRPGHQMG